MEVLQQHQSRCIADDRVPRTQSRGRHQPPEEEAWKMVCYFFHTSEIPEYVWHGKSIVGPPIALHTTIIISCVIATSGIAFVCHLTKSPHRPLSVATCNISAFLDLVLYHPECFIAVRFPTLMTTLGLLVGQCITCLTRWCPSCR